MYLLRNRASGGSRDMVHKCSSRHAVANAEVRRRLGRGSLHVVVKVSSRSTKYERPSDFDALPGRRVVNMHGHRPLRYTPHCSQNILGENPFWWPTAVCRRMYLGSGGRNRVG